MKNIKIPKGFSDWDISNDKMEKELYRGLRDDEPESFRNSELINNLDSMTFLRDDGAGNSLVHDKRDNKLKIYYHDWEPDTLHDLSRHHYVSGDEWSEMQELKEKAKKDLPGMFETKKSRLRENTIKALPYIGATAMGALGAWAGHSEPTDKIKNVLKMGGTLAAIGGGTGWAIGDEMKKRNSSVDMKSLNSYMKNTYGKDGYTDLNQALREIGSLEEQRYYDSKGVPKMAFDIVNESFEKVAGLSAKQYERYLSKDKHAGLAAIMSDIRYNKIPKKDLGLILDAAEKRNYLNGKTPAPKVKGLKFSKSNLNKKMMMGGIGAHSRANVEEFAKASRMHHNIKKGAIAGAGALALGAGAYGIKKLKDREKKASDVINEGIEKIANRFYTDNGNLQRFDIDSFVNINDFADYEAGNLGGENLVNAAWDKANRDVTGYFNSHPKKQQALEEMKFNDDRSKIKSKVGAGLGNAVALGGTLGSAALNMKLRKVRGGSGGAIKGAVVGALPSILAGGAVSNKMNERKRTKEMGPAKYDAQDEIIKDTRNHFKGKRYGY